MSEQIKPCPFCGHVGLDFEEGSTFRWILPNCAGCGATRGEVRIQTLGDGTRMEWLDAAKADAIKAWNTRATQPQAPQGGGTPGFQLVPLVPTEEMLDAAFDCNALEVAQAINREKFPQITEPWASNGSVFAIQYAAALRAAPTLKHQRGEK